MGEEARDGQRSRVRVREERRWLTHRAKEAPFGELMQGVGMRPCPFDAQMPLLMRSPRLQNEMKLITTSFLSVLCYGPVHVGVFDPWTYVDQILLFHRLLL